MAFGSGAVVNVGTIQAYGGNTAPDGWLICDGSAISRTLYADLFAVIGETYGAGDGSTTFNIPNGKIPVGFNINVKGNNKSLGWTDGSMTAAMVTGGQYANKDAFVENGYNTNIATYVNSGNRFPDTNKTIGITTDGTKSGIIADLTSASAVSNAIIKY